MARLAPSPANPLDLGAIASPETFANALDLLAASGEFDAAVVAVTATLTNDVPTVLEALAPIADCHTQLPLAVVVLGAHGVDAVGQRRAPIFDLPERAVSALGRAARYATWRSEPLGCRPSLSGVDSNAARNTINAMLAECEGWQPYGRIADILACYGIPVLPAISAFGEDEMIAQVARLGFPVAMKMADPRVVHKADVRGVRLNIRDEQEGRSAYRAIGAAMGSQEPVVIIQPMAAGQVELVAGIVHDPLFGSLVMVGLGGVTTDILVDRAFRLVPLTDRDATRMWRSLQSAPLLTGYRGSPAVNTDAVEDLLLRVGRLAEELPEVAELDLNPVLASEQAVVVVDAKMRLAAVGPEPEATSRQLKQPS